METKSQVYDGLNDEDSEHRSDTLLHLLENDKDSLKNVDVIISKDDTLIYLGPISDGCVKGEILDHFQEGLFAFDQSDPLKANRLILIVGIVTTPTQREYNSIYIPEKYSTFLSNARAAKILDNERKM